MKKIFLVVGLTIIFIQCVDSPTKHKSKDALNISYVKDVHSNAQPDQVFVNHLSLDIACDFDRKVISGSATYNLVVNNPAASQVIFDTDELDIQKVEVDGKEVKFNLGEQTDQGVALIIPINSSSEMVKIFYETNPGSEAVQWLDPEQTAGKNHPYLFTQGQAILTRSWIPCQDSPGIRITYDARVKVPKDLLAIMSASNPTEKNGKGIYTYEMKQAIPPYLIALAIGDIEFKSIDKRTGVYAEPSVLKDAAYEFGDMEKMLEAAEALYGPYKWDRYDVVVLPPSFPFGGMENPKLTFATPTILAGDRSLTALIAHEMAHSWSGNLVTNATWDDFWLNEGFTVYFEYRIMEALYGKDYTDMLRLIGYQDLQRTIDEMLPQKPADTHLKLNLEGRNPDDGMTDVAYEKGHLFLRTLEETYGREKFDEFLKTYFESHAFQSMTTEKFMEYLNQELISKSDIPFDVDAWVYGPGLPTGHFVMTSDGFSKVEKQLDGWLSGNTSLVDIPTKNWSTHEWLHFIRHLPPDLSKAKMKELDDAFHFTESHNSEITFVWLLQSIKCDYGAAYPKLNDFLVNVGRRKFLTPLYVALRDKGEGGKNMAISIYENARPNYHAVSRNTIDEKLHWKEE